MAKSTNKDFELASKYNRLFSDSFKRQLVKDIVEKRISVKDSCKLYDISRTSIYNWLYLYGSIDRGVKTVVQMESEQSKTRILQERLAEYERIIGQKQMQIDLLEKSFELISEELGYDVKKKHVPLLWNGSASTPINIATE